MRRQVCLTLILFSLFCIYIASVSAQTASFNIPDTVCINTPVNITNTSTGASSFYWNFCVADISKAPVATNIGNIGNLSQPVFMDYAFDNNNYYGFVTNYNTGRLIRLDFGNSLLNTPTPTDLGNFGGILPSGIGTEGIQVVQNEGKWYAIIVGGYSVAGSTPRVVKIEFGANLNNPAPAATNWGNLGNMEQPIDLHVFKENNNWYGFTVNAENNTITRFNFTNSFNNTPTAVNLGNIGNLRYPTGIYAINDNNFWRVFIVNGGDNTTNNGPFSLTRLDFGNSLLNTPTGVNLGSLGNTLQHPRDLTIMRSCGQIIGFAVNARPGYDGIISFDFKNDLSSTPVATNLGNIGNVSFPHSISKLFRVNEDLYSFVTNANNNTITRLRFTGCTNASVPNSNAQNPAPVTYNQPGTYNINLTIDDGLPTQSSFCKQVVVLPVPPHAPTQNIILCSGNAKRIGTSTPANTYKWSTGATTDSIDVTQSGTYWVDISNLQCTTRDSFIVTNETAAFSFVQDAFNPLSIRFTNETANTTSADWDFGDGNSANNSPTPTHLFGAYTDYPVKLTALTTSGCVVSISKQVSVQVVKDDIIINKDTLICAGSSFRLQALSATTYCWSPTTYLSDPTIANPVTTTPQSITYYLTTKTGTIVKLDSVVITVSPKPDITYRDTIPTCKGLQLYADPNGHTVPMLHWSWDFGDGNSFDDAIDILHSYEKAGTYQVKLYAEDYLGCKDTAVKTIQIDTVTAMASAASSLICPADPVTLTATGGTIFTWTPALYLNNNTVASPIATLDSTRLFQVTVANEIGCSDTASVRVAVLQRPAFRKPLDKDVCIGSAVQLDANNDLNYIYQWTPATYLDDPIIPTPKANPPVSTQYAVHIEEPMCHYDTSFNVMVIAHDAPFVAAQKVSDIDCTVTTAQLNATGASTYTWSPAHYLNFPNSPNPVASIDTTTKFYVLGVDQYGCSAMDSIVVNVTATNKPVFGVPNAFTPNHDGKNDCFGIKHWGNVTIKEFQVFNRWGQKLFSTTQPGGCWDGNFNGTPQPAGGYVYVIIADTFCGTIKRTGSFMLIR